MMEEEILTPGWRCAVRREPCDLSGSGGWTYGLQILTVGTDGAVLAEVRDVTTDRALAEQAAARFTAGQLSPVHLRDAVEDLLLWN